MSSTYSPDLRIELIGTGDQAGVWGNTTNTNLSTVLENSIAGYTSVSVIASSQALTANYGAADEARYAAIALTTTTGANFAVYAPPASKLYVIYNASSYTATIYNSTVLGNTTAAGTGVAIPAGKTMTIWSDGTNFAQQNTHLISPTIASATLTTPALGTPASGTLTNATGLPVATGISGLGTGVATFLATPSSANLAAAVTGETGSGALVFATSPTLVTPALGTPASGVLTSCTGLPMTTGVTGILPIANGGVGTASFTGTGNNVFSNSPTLVTPTLGTPASATLTNATGLPVATGISGLGTGVATALAVNVGTAGAALVNGGVLGTPSSGTLTNTTGLPIDGGTTGTLPVNRGGTGATSISSGALVKGAGAGAFSAASAADIVGQIGSTAVQNATNATTAANGGVTSVNGSSGAVTVNALGINQTYQDLTASRALNTTYTNSTGKPIIVFVHMDFGDLSLYVDSVLIWFFIAGGSARAQMFVPPGSTYIATAASGRTFDTWLEYR